MSKKTWVQAGFTIGATSFLLSGCAIYATFFEWEPVAESRQYPKKPNFSILPPFRSLEDSGVIDFSALYYKCLPQIKYDEYVIGPSYNFMRFWPSGHVYKRVDGHVPSAKDADSFHSAYMGFYGIDGTNFTMELFVRRFGYITSRGYIVDGDIYIYEIERRTTGKPDVHAVDHWYKHLHIDGFRRAPDWSPTGMLQCADERH